MRRAALAFATSVLLLGSPPAFGVDGTRLKWVTSIYIDGDGASLKKPEGVACTDDRLLVADTGNNRLLQYTYQGESVMAEAEIPLPKASPIRVSVSAATALPPAASTSRRLTDRGPRTIPHAVCGSLRASACVGVPDGATRE